MYHKSSPFYKQIKIENYMIITSFSPEIEFLPSLFLLPVRDNKFINK